MSERAPFFSQFDLFYHDHFVREHRQPMNIAFHVAGVLGSTAFLLFALVRSAPWLALLYPVIHALPGLLGHRLFERSAPLGDLRITRKDFPMTWFILANHRLAWSVLTLRYRPNATRPAAPEGSLAGADTPLRSDETRVLNAPYSLPIDRT
jgi:hypothetical protein